MMTFYPIQRKQPQSFTTSGHLGLTLWAMKTHAWASSLGMWVPQPSQQNSGINCFLSRPHIILCCYTSITGLPILYLIVNDYSTSLTRQSACGRQEPSLICVWIPAHDGQLGSYFHIGEMLVQCEQHPHSKCPQTINYHPSSVHMADLGLETFNSIYK